MRVLSVLNTETRTKVFLRTLAGICTFTSLLCFAAFIRIPLPFTPVPITLQNLVVFLAGACLAPGQAAISVGLYIGIGLLGAPLFANAGAGFLYFFSPTGGYLLGFLVAAWLISSLKNLTKPSDIMTAYATMLAGMFVIYALGGLWLIIGYHWTIKQALLLGVLPFVLPDMMKAFVAAAVAARLAK